ncbi:segregation and condensation protein A [Desulfuribacillus alkaliarsenatis]|uniref:Segregation and condensation protein A n=1 Tax=Desulfuribacillus alkaliarsenatis TaxID=766136 RepID=A0A1E5G5X2_9FIRM|nr:segregation/condensation protein A [Desulfuribacillus alkaliarsenatis]OEF98495.1 hypothetical protein BHF68_02135 [Desulfuribacillus alkaliarsenatis]
MAYKVRLESFEGPLDLLLHLIDKAEVDIYDISIAEITQQYLEYLNALQKLELDIASEFILMAATLLSIKSRKLLPKPIELLEPDLEYEELDPQAELIRRLIEYKKYKNVTEFLKERELNRGLFLSKPPSALMQSETSGYSMQLDGISIYELVRAYIFLMQKRNKIEPVATIQKDQISVQEKIEHIRIQLKEKDIVSFSNLIITNNTAEVVSTLLAVLELMKSREVTCIQDSLFEDFIIIPVVNEAREDMGDVNG